MITAERLKLEKYILQDRRELLFVTKAVLNHSWCFHRDSSSGNWENGIPPGMLHGTRLLPPPGTVIRRWSDNDQA